MLQTKWLVFLFMAFGFGSILCGVAEMSLFGGQAEASPKAVFDPFFETWIAVTSFDFGKLVSLFLSGDMFKSAWAVFMWDYAVFEGPWNLLRWLILIPISVAMALTMILTTAGLIRGSGT